jgi:hypothetical protein
MRQQDYDGVGQFKTEYEAIMKSLIELERDKGEEDLRKAEERALVFDGLFALLKHVSLQFGKGKLRMNLKDIGDCLKDSGALAKLDTVLENAKLNERSVYASTQVPGLDKTGRTAAIHAWSIAKGRVVAATTKRDRFLEKHPNLLGAVLPGSSS